MGSSPTRPTTRVAFKQEVSGDRPVAGNAWAGFVPFFPFDVEIRTVICSTDAIEAVNARRRRAVRSRGHFPDGAAAHTGSRDGAGGGAAGSSGARDAQTTDGGQAVTSASRRGRSPVPATG
ncbi:transposase [Actinacidiphila sp. ITFR-21]|uniref:transposase n=1 Tax=Actinacidiphila sp. ITFR-21 TaxID=3075199 RepID=UPI0037DA516E